MNEVADIMEKKFSNFDGIVDCIRSLQSKTGGMKDSRNGAKKDSVMKAKSCMKVPRKGVQGLTVMSPKSNIINKFGKAKRRPGHITRDGKRHPYHNNFKHQRDRSQSELLMNRIKNNKGGNMSRIVERKTRNMKGESILASEKKRQQKKLDSKKDLQG